MEKRSFPVDHYRLYRTNPIPFADLNNSSLNCGAASSIRASARWELVLPFKLAIPYSVTTYIGSMRESVMMPVKCGTILEIFPSFAVE